MRGWLIATIAVAMLLGGAPDGASAQGKKATKAAGKTTRILRVGPKRKLKFPSHAARIARAGDTVEIDAGDYVDCAVWRTRRLTLKGVGGYAHVHDRQCGKKAIWVFYNGPVTISRIRFSFTGIRLKKNDDDAIRWEGDSLLTVLDSWFHDNTTAILTHNRRTSSLVVLRSHFERNGNCTVFCAHGIYAGSIKTMVVRDSKFVGQSFGHHIKSRALYSEIVRNRIEDGVEGTASFSINLPNGGTALIRGNYIQKGPKSDNNKGMIAIGEEGATNPSRGIVIRNNVFLNAQNRETNFVWNRSKQKVLMQGNRFHGPGSKLKGPGRVR